MVRISVDLPEDVAEGLGRMALAQSSSPERLLLAAARDLVADHAALRASIDRGLADVAAGRVTDHEVVMAELDRWVEDLEVRGRTQA